ncbi:hypothetical protein DFH08DRAFT_1083189 [Mycena albidolilacea]|uniref:DUF4048 domain-containing protein n=1 Tax=Mycena albidolilacea TaxID=1033008 RepID=A0AAD7EMN4_9AGAR|nr:hypothetical protein DFH08DRAFT_1083189 [Mycena albidolilacea]
MSSSSYSKRHSMPVVPRPLQLANTDGLASAPLSAKFAPSPSPLLSPAPSTPTTPRRASSIIYNPASRPPRAGHRSSLQRSNSVGGALDMQQQRKSSLPPERSPVTLAEKHADLLHFIAQKESKCLELRSQLAVHEAELLQLKRKWERIVSRGFTSPHNPAPSPSAAPSSSSSYFASHSNHSNSNSASSNASSHPTPGTSLGAAALSALEPTNAAVLDGIREGVQGVGRSIIAALSPTAAGAGAGHHPSASAAAYAESVLNGHGHGRTHSKNSSLSTLATATSTSTSTSTKSRFSLSQSSQSSLGEEPPLTPDLSVGEVDGVEVQEGDGEDGEGGAQVLMVHDTGATPTMSPNPAFSARRAARDRASASAAARQAGAGGDSSAEAEEDFFFAQAQVAAAAKTRTPSSPSTARPAAGKRGSAGGAIPGLTGGLVDSVGVSAWVGSVGKKWEELQRVPTFAKNTKRASLLFSDIAYALQVGPAPSSASSPLPSASASRSRSPQPQSKSPTPSSLLDDDDGEMGLPAAPALSPTMLTPTPAKLAPTPAMLTPTTLTRKAGLAPARQQQQQPQSPLSLAKSRAPPKAPQQQKEDVVDDDDEWNW